MRLTDRAAGNAATSPRGVATTPGGGAVESGTKKETASGLRDDPEPKSVTPSAARSVPSIKKLPVKLFAGFTKIA